MKSSKEKRPRESNVRSNEGRGRTDIQLDLFFHLMKPKLNVFHSYVFLNSYMSLQVNKFTPSCLCASVFICEKEYLNLVHPTPYFLCAALAC